MPLSTGSSADDPRAHLAAIVDSSDDAIVSKNLDGVIQSWNRGAERIFGYTAAEVVGQPITMLIPPERQAEEVDILARLRRGERVEHLETVRATKDGRRIDVSLTVSPIRDASGAVVGASKIARDITGQKRAEGELSYLAAIVDSSDDAILSKNLEGIIQSWNPGAQRIFGYSPGEVIGRPVTLLIPDELQAEEAAILARLRSGERVEHFETTRLTKDGRRIEVSLTISPIRDRSGAVIGASKIARDITERKRTADALAAQREWFRVTLSSIGDAVIASDPEGRVTYLNGLAEKLTGWTVAEAVGQPLTDVFRIVNEETRAAVANPAKKVLATGLVVGLANHTILISRDGSERAIADSAAPIVGSEKRIVGVVMVFRDETDRREAAAERERLLHRERKARAEAEQANRVKDEFVAMVSHELRTPLNAIVGWAQMLRMGQLDEATSLRAIETIDRNAHAQARLISDLLDISRILSGKLSLENHLVDVTSLVENTVETFKPGALAKGVTVKVASDLSEGKAVGDPTRLQQVLSNLLSNAIKFTPAGGCVDLTVRREADDAVIAVRDTGRGIELDFLPHVFDRFRQADASTTRKHGGLGLGLAIVQHLVRLHRGQVTAESDGPGQGATFTVRLPMAMPRGQALSLRETSELSECAPEVLEGRRVLVVEDERDTLELLTYSLGKCGAEVMGAQSVREALDLFQRSRPDVVVSDIGMADQDGYDLIRAIRRFPPEAGGAVPAVAVTAFVGREDRRAALDAGFQEHVAKPIKPAMLAAVIADLLKRDTASPSP
jgi:PAS domain S-box-containing protein